MYHNSQSYLNCTKEMLQIPKGSKQCLIYSPLAATNPQSGPALGGWACRDHHLGSPAGFKQCKPMNKTEKREERSGTSPPSLPDSQACLKATVPWGPPPQFQLSTLSSGNLWRIKGFSPLLSPECFFQAPPPHPTNPPPLLVCSLTSVICSFVPSRIKSLSC